MMASQHWPSIELTYHAPLERYWPRCWLASIGPVSSQLTMHHQRDIGPVPASQHWPGIEPAVHVSSISGVCGRLILTGGRFMVGFPDVYEPLIQPWLLQPQDLWCKAIRSEVKVGAAHARLPANERAPQQCLPRQVARWFVSFTNYIWKLLT